LRAKKSGRISSSAPVQSGRTLVIILQANKYFHEKGGSERYMFALSLALAARGHEIVDFSMEHPRNMPSRYRRHFVANRDYDAGAAHSPRAAREFIRSPQASRRMAGLLDEVMPDVAHLHNIYHQLTPSIIKTLSDRGVPMVMTLHDYKLVCPSYAMFARGDVCYRCRGGRFHRAVAVGCGGTRLRSALLALESYWQRWTRVYDRVDCFIAPSEYLRRVMLEAGIAAERIVFVAPLNPSSVTAAPASAAEGALLELPPRFVAYVGRLSPEKGIHVLLAAMARTTGIPLVVFGDGPEGPALRRTAGERRLEVIFAGHAGRATIDFALRRACAVMLPTLSPENAPMAILEAADAGVPVIVSDRGGLPELARRVGGVVVPAGDDAALANAITAAWEETEHWRERARSAWRESEPLHGVDAHVRSIESVYHMAIARRRAA
jgi:glycosyltransferase involved in cell wall biosynthesis